jgi:Spy/CpxP family protein refolding chaperone
MKKCLLTSAIFLLSLTAVNAQDKKSNENTDYMQVITKRSEKIVDGLKITDSVKYKRVCNIIVDQYHNLSNIHDSHDAKVKEVKENATADKAIVKSEVAKLDSATDRELSKLHLVYLAKLSKELTPAQVTEVKDAMTYKILPLTYAAYLDELPALTDVQKQKIMELLTEARERAIDAGSAGKKHEWFGKYKGKINNYLSAQGYDMKKAGEEWQKRIKEKQKG